MELVPRKQSTHSWSGRGRQPATSSKRLLGTGRLSPVQPSEDGTKILWMGVYGESKGLRGPRGCALAMAESGVGM